MQIITKKTALRLLALRTKTGRPRCQISQSKFGGLSEGCQVVRISKDSRKSSHVLTFFEGKEVRFEESGASRRARRNRYFTNIPVHVPKSER